MEQDMLGEIGEGLAASQSRSELYAEEMFGSAALIVVGEPTTEEHKNAILERISKGLSSWDVEGTGCDVSAELKDLASEEPAGVAGSNGEHLIRHGSDSFQLQVVFNPRTETLCEGIRELLLPPTKHKHIVFAGYNFTGTGDWVIQDSSFRFADFAAVFNQPDVAAALQEQKESTLTIHCGLPTGHWTQEHIQKSIVGKSLKTSVDPAPCMIADPTGIIQFTDYLSYFIKVLSSEELLVGSNVVGNIRFTKPTLYIFPGAQGDCAVFGVHGFNMLIDGGYSRRACFWEFARHLDRLDVLLVSRISQDNLFGIKSFLQRKLQSEINPEITYSFFNGITGKDSSAASSLSVSLLEESALVSSYLKSLGCRPGSCHASTTPVKLYHKIGHGTLEMYVLNPSKDSTESKEMMKQLSGHTDHFSVNKAGIPINETCSVSALLVWKSHTGEVARILYPGSTPQTELFKNLEHTKELELFKFPTGSKTGPKVKKQPTQLKKTEVSSMSESKAKVEPPSAAVAPPVVDLPEPVTEPLLDAGMPATEAFESVSPRDAWQEKIQTEPSSLPDPPISADTCEVPSAPEKPEAREEQVEEKELEASSEENETGVGLGDVPTTKNDMLLEQELPIEHAHVEQEETPQDTTANSATCGSSLAAEEVTDEVVSSAGDITPSNETEQTLIDDYPAESAGMENLPSEEQESATTTAAHEMVEEMHSTALSDTILTPEEDVTGPEVSEDTAVPVTSDSILSPVLMEDRPVSSEDIPAPSEDAPGISEDAPRISEDTPAPSDGAPGLSGDMPILSEDKPVSSKDTPISFEDTPASFEDTAVPSEDTPVTYEDTPASSEDTSVPHEETSKPCEDTTVPSGDIIEASAPVISEEAPVLKLEEPLPEVSQDDSEPKAPEVILDSETFDNTAAAVSSEDTEAPVSSEDTEARVTSEDTETLVTSEDTETPVSSENILAPVASDDKIAPEFSEDGAVPVASEDAVVTEASEVAAVSEDAPLMTSSQEADYREEAEKNQDEFEVGTEEQDSTLQPENKATDEQAQASNPCDFTVDSIDDASTEPSREDSLEPSIPNQSVPSVVIPDEVEETSGDDTKCEQPQQVDEPEPDFSSFPKPQNTDPMTTSFIDESTVGQGGLVSSVDGNVSMGRSIDSSEVEGCSNRSVANSTPALNDFDSFAGSTSVSDIRDLQESPTDEQPNELESFISTIHQLKKVKRGASILEETSSPFTLSSLHSDLNPLAAEFNPSSLSNSGSSNGEQSAVKTDLLSGWAGTYCDGCASESTVSPVVQPSSAEAAEEFDPLKAWGEPQNLPSPPSPTPAADSAAAGDAPNKKPKSAAKVGEVKKRPSTGTSSLATKTNGEKAKPAASKVKSATTSKTTTKTSQPAAVADKTGKSKTVKKTDTPDVGTKSTTDKKPAKPTSAGATKTAALKPKTGTTAVKKSSAVASERKAPSDKKTAEPEKKPAEKKTATEPKVKTSLLKPKTAKLEDIKPKASKAEPGTPKSKVVDKADLKTSRPSSAMKSKPAVSKTTAVSTKTSGSKSAAGPKVTPMYVELAYVPHHGESKFVGIEFFQLIHARYYVFSGRNPSSNAFDALLNAKANWDASKDWPVTIIPTYDTDTLHHWLAANREQLGQLNIDVAPASNRCFVQLAAGNSSFPAYRLEF